MSTTSPLSPEEMCRAYYQAFNTRQLNDAAAMFLPQARLQQTSAQPLAGSEGYLTFAESWLAAFPDAVFGIEDITAKRSDLYDVDLIATGTHQGTLRFGSWVFRPTGLSIRLGMREVLEIESGRFRATTLSVDSQELVRQLTRINVPIVLEHLSRISSLAQQLAGTTFNADKQREILERLGRELDVARNSVRPYFR